MHMKTLAVIGYPIAHSLSPAMHNAAFQYLDLPYVYEALAIASEDLSEAINGYLLNNYAGFNVTIPHKEAVYRTLDALSDEAHMVGAVNTVIRTERGWLGHNTDVAGFVKPLLDEYNLKQSCVLVLGAGGAARAVVCALAQQAEVASIRLVARTIEKAKAIQNNMKVHFPHVDCQVVGCEQEVIAAADVIVNTTPVGMKPEDTDLFPREWLQSSTFCYDLIYWPKQSRFLQQAQQQGCATLNGLEMLLWQGVYAWELWIGQTAPVEVMKAALQASLRERISE